MLGFVPQPCFPRNPPISSLKKSKSLLQRSPYFAAALCKKHFSHIPNKTILKKQKEISGGHLYNLGSVAHTFDRRGRGRLISEFQAIQGCIVRPCLKNRKLKTSSTTVSCASERLRRIGTERDLNVVIWGKNCTVVKRCRDKARDRTLDLKAVGKVLLQWVKYMKFREIKWLQLAQYL